MHVCACMSLHVYMCIHFSDMREHMVCMDMFYARVCMHKYVCVYSTQDTNMHTSIDRKKYMHDVCECIHTYIHTDMHTCVYMCMFTFTPSFVLALL